LDNLIQRKIKINTSGIKAEAEKIQSEEWYNNIIKKLKLIDEIVVIPRVETMHAPMDVQQFESKQLMTDIKNKFYPQPQSMP
jgi:hypothetical protein